MMRSLLRAAACVSALLATVASASARADEATASAAAVEDVPSYRGQPGLLRVVSAAPSHPGRIALAARMGGFGADDYLGSGERDTYLQGKLALDYSFLSWLDAGLCLQMGTNYNGGQDPPSQAFGADAYPRVRFTYPLGDVAVGALVGLRLLAGVNSAFFDPGATGADARFLFTYAPRSMGPHRPLRIHANVGYTLDRSGFLTDAALDPVYRFANGISDRSWARLGLGGEWQSRLLTPFAELSADNPLGEGLLPWQSPSRLAAGVRSSPLSGLILEGSLEIGLSGFHVEDAPPPPPWMFVVGAGYTFAPFTRVEVHREVADLPTLAGLITDAATGAPLEGAQVAFPHTDASSVVTSASGRFRAVGLPVGRVQVEVSRDGYKPARATATLAASGAVAVEVALTPLPAEGHLVGRVLDLDGNPLPATLSIIARGGEAPVQRETNGELDLTLPAGDYQITATAPNALTSGRRFRLDAKEKVLLELVLRPIPQQPAATLQADRIAISQRINFAFGKAELLADAKPILDQVVDILLRHSEIAHLRIEGHTDDVGGADFNMSLSRERAASVKGYLAEHGVDGARLATLGCGDTRPLVKGTGPDARAANRRVEFVIVQ